MSRAQHDCEGRVWAASTCPGCKAEIEARKRGRELKLSRTPYVPQTVTQANYDEELAAYVGAPVTPSPLDTPLPFGAPSPETGE